MNSKNLLLIFTRNPELGKVKTRLAKSVGDKIALDIYQFLLQKTKEVTKNISCDKTVYYSEKIIEDDLWNRSNYQKKEQFGKDLGEKMKNAIEDGFNKKYKKIIVIGSDLFDLKPSLISDAFKKLDNNDVIIGPAIDGGYYLIGQKKIHLKIFENKNWGTSTVREDTLKNLEKVDVHLLPMLNDIDVIEDIKNHSAFTKFLKPR